MNHRFIFILLGCLVLTGAASAYLYQCDQNSKPFGQPTSIEGRIVVAALPQGLTFTVDPGLSSAQSQTTTEPISNIVFVMNAGNHDFKASRNGYKDLTDVIQVCPQRETFVQNLMLVPGTTVTTPALSARSGSGLALVAVTTTPTQTFVAQRNAGIRLAQVTTPVTGTTTLPAGVTTMVTQAGSTNPAGDSTGGIPGSGSGSSSPGTGQGAGPATTGSLSVTTTPAGASIFLDGVQRGVSPATIPGIAPGDHTLLLRLDGYGDLSTPVLITVGQTQAYTTGLSPAANTGADPAATKSPGFAFVPALMALGGIVALRKKQR